MRRAVRLTPVMLVVLQVLAFASACRPGFAIYVYNGGAKDVFVSRMDQSGPPTRVPLQEVRSLGDIPRTAPSFFVYRMTATDGAVLGCLTYTNWGDYSHSVTLKTYEHEPCAPLGY